jgi:hypothetical protein
LTLGSLRLSSANSLLLTIAMKSDNL